MHSAFSSQSFKSKWPQAPPDSSVPQGKLCLFFPDNSHNPITPNFELNLWQWHIGGVDFLVHVIN
jgi:hypothetical protein